MSVGIQPHMPVLAAPTRWDAHYNVLKRFQQIHPALAEMTREELGYASQAEHGEEWLAVSGAYPHVRPLCDLLGVFARCTQEMQAAKLVTLSRVPGMVDRLLRGTSAKASEGEHQADYGAAACRRGEAPAGAATDSLVHFRRLPRSGTGFESIATRTRATRWACSTWLLCVPAELERIFSLARVAAAKSTC